MNLNLNKVTWFSKLLALGLLFFVILISFLVGSSYQWPKDATKTKNTIFNELNRPSQKITDGWTTYSSKEYGFEFKYPGNWVLNESLDSMGTDSPTISFKDPKILTEGFDVGSIIPPQFYITVLKKDNYKEVPLETNWKIPPDEFTRDERTINISNQDATLYNFSSSAAEGAKEITKFINITKDNNVYLLQYSYTLAGCNNMAQAFQNECVEGNMDLINNSENIINKIIFTFKFIQQTFDQACGGSIERQCPSGYKCKLVDPLPGASGVCVPAEDL